MNRRPTLAIIRPYRPNLAEMALYRPLLAEFDTTYFYTGVDEESCRKQLDALGLEKLKAVRYRGYTDFIKTNILQRGIDFKVGFGSMMLSHLGDVMRHDIINVVDPVYEHAHQIVARIRPEQKLIVVRWENIYGRHNSIWRAAPRTVREMGRADAVVCTSLAAQHTLEVPPGFKGLVEVLYPGVRVNPAGPAPRSGTGSGNVVLFTGRPQWGKGLSYLLAAMMILRRDLQVHAKLWVIGVSADEVKGFPELVASGHVRFFGRVPNDEVRRKMAEADVFCFPSVLSPTWSEQFGYAMVEAMLQALPVVAFDSGCIREVCGSDGVYASAGNAYSLAKALESVLASPEDARQRGQRLRLRAEQAFDADKQGLKMLRITREVAGREVPAPQLQGVQ